MKKKRFEIFSVDDSSLAKQIADDLLVELGLNLDYQSETDNSIFGNLSKETFSDGEMSVQFENSIRGKYVFLVGCTDTPENREKMFLAIDAAKRASAKEITAVVPYCGYSRQDKKEGTRGPIGAKLMADLLQAAGINRIVTLDLHSDSIQGFFNVPVDHLNGYTVFSNILKETIIREQLDVCICSPDSGGTKRALRFKKKLSEFNPDFALLEKERDKPNSISKMILVGSVKDKDCIIIDDMSDTSGTLCKAAEKLIESGAKSVRAVITHGVFSGKANEIIDSSVIKEVFVSDTLVKNVKSSKMTIVCTSKIFAGAIKSIVYHKSMDVINS